MRTCLSTIVQEVIPDANWKLAQLGVSNGGIGWRDPSFHAEAAYVAAFTCSATLCQTIWENYDPRDTLNLSHALSAASAFNDKVKTVDNVTLERPLKQHKLSKAIESAAFDRLLADNLGVNDGLRAVASLNRLENAGAWLQACPRDQDREMEGEIFQIALKRRIRLRVCEEDRFCRCCGETLDSFGDHALVCIGAGCRTEKHDKVRNLLATEADTAGATPEIEKIGLLPAYGLNGAGEDPTGVPLPPSRRRPADIYFPRGLDIRQRGPVAVDIAITSGLQEKHFRHVVTENTKPSNDYETKKRTHNDTEDRCTRAGLTFQPAIFETHSGGWVGGSAKVVNFITKGQQARGLWAPEGIANRVAQRISTSLHRESARAILFRLNGARRLRALRTPPAVVENAGDWSDSSDEE